MAIAHNAAHAGLILLTCLLSANGRTVCDIPSLKAELGFRPPHTSTEFELEVKAIAPCTLQNKAFYVTDGTNTLMLVDEAHWPALAFSANDIIHVKGRIRDRGNPDCLSIQVVGKGAPEPITDLTLGDLVAGQSPASLVRVRGTVRSARQDEIDPEWAFLTLYDRGNAIKVDFMPSQEELHELQKLIGAEVAVVGVPHPQRWEKNHNRRISPASLSARSLDSFTILKSPDDPFLSQSLEESDVLRGTAAAECRRSAHGHVLAIYGGSHVVLRDDRGAILNVELSGDVPPALNARICVAGYPATDLYRLNLTDAVWRPEPGVPLPHADPQDVSLVDLLTDGRGRTMIKPVFHGQPIRIRGILRTLANVSGRLMVESERMMIAVDIGPCPDVTSRLSPGCEVEVSGICVMPTDNWQANASPPRIREVFIALRTADDIRVLRRPPWWTAQRLLLLIAALIAGLAVIAVWNRLLKRKVERRSRELLDEQIAHVTSDLKTMERTRLAIELHDSLAQNLTGVALELQTAKDLVYDDAETAAAHLETADRSLKSCREELRNCLRDLRSEALETDDVNAAIRMTLDPHTADANVTIRFNVPRERLTANTMHALLRIIRELVLNAVRHGHATAIKVAGAIENGKLLFSVADNGCGFDVDNHPGLREGHFGLQGVHDRIRSFEGEMEVRSDIGRGTKVMLALTLPKEDNSCRN